MNKIILKGLLSCIVMSQALYASQDADPNETALQEFLGKQLGAEKVAIINKTLLSTPPRNRIPVNSENGLTPRTKELVKKQTEDTLYWNDIQKKYKEAISNLNDKIEECKRIELTLSSTKESEKALSSEIDKFKSMMAILADKYYEKASFANEVGLSSLLKSKIASVIREVTQKLDNNLSKSDKLFSYKKAELYKLATSLTIAINNPQERAIVNINSLYDKILHELESIRDLEDFELTEDQREQITKFFEEKYNELILALTHESESAIKVETLDNPEEEDDFDYEKMTNLLDMDPSK